MTPAHVRSCRNLRCTRRRRRVHASLHPLPAAPGAAAQRAEERRRQGGMPFRSHASCARFVVGCCRSPEMVTHSHTPQVPEHVMDRMHTTLEPPPAACSAPGVASTGPPACSPDAAVGPTARCSSPGGCPGSHPAAGADGAGAAHAGPQPTLQPPTQPRSCMASGPGGGAAEAGCSGSSGGGAGGASGLTGGSFEHATLVLDAGEAQSVNDLAQQ